MFRNNIAGIAAAEREAIERLRFEFDAELGRLNEETEKRLGEASAEISEAAKARGRVEEFEKDTLPNYLDRWDEVFQYLDRQKEAIDKDLDEFKRRIEEAIALQGPVTYWGNVRKAQKRHSIWWGLGTTGLLGVTFWLLLQFAENTVLPAIARSVYGPLAVFVLVSAFRIWLIRLAARNFLASVHGWADARQRETIIQTYLALAETQDGMTPEDRRLLLGAIFAPRFFCSDFVVFVSSGIAPPWGRFQSTKESALPVERFRST